MSDTNQTPEMLFVVHPLHLEEEEIQYELNIRRSIGELPNDYTLSPVGRLMQRLELDSRNAINPLTHQTGFDEPKLKEEVEVCEGKIRTLGDNIRDTLASIEIPVVGLSLF